MKRPDFYFLFPLIFGELLLLIALQSGLKFTSDSHLYLTGADHIISHGFNDLFKQPVFLAKPILYPLLLALLGKNLVLLKTSHLLIYAISFYLFNSIVKKLIENKFNRLLVNLMFVLSAAILMDHAFVWTESFFMTLLLADFYLLIHFIEKKQVTTQILMLIIGVMMIGLRHVGIVFVMTISLGMMLSLQNIWKGRSFRVLAISHGLIPLFLFGWWQYQVYHVGKNTERLAHFEGLSVLQNVSILSDGFSIWFMPAILPSSFRITFSVLLLILLFVLIGKYLWKTKMRPFYQIVAFTMMSYVGLLLTKGDMIFSDNERYLSLVYPFLMLFLFKIGEEVLNEKPKIKPHLLSASGVLLLYHLIRVVKNVWFWSGIS